MENVSLAALKIIKNMVTLDISTKVTQHWSFTLVVAIMKFSILCSSPETEVAVAAGENFAVVFSKAKFVG